MSISEERGVEMSEISCRGLKGCPHGVKHEGWNNEVTATNIVGSFYCIHCPRFAAINRDKMVVTCNDTIPLDRDSKPTAKIGTQGRNDAMARDRAVLKKGGEAAKRAIVNTIRERAAQLYNKHEIGEICGLYCGTIIRLAKEANIPLYTGGETHDVLAIMIDRYNDGAQYHEIAEELDISSGAPSVHHAIKKVREIYPELITREPAKAKQIHHKWTDDDAQLISAMQSDGYTLKQIAAEIGVKVPALTHYMYQVMKK